MDKVIGLINTTEKFSSIALYPIGKRRCLAHFDFFSIAGVHYKFSPLQMATVT